MLCCWYCAGLWALWLVRLSSTTNVAGRGMPSTHRPAHCFLMACSCLPSAVTAAHQRDKLPCCLRRRVLCTLSSRLLRHSPPLPPCSRVPSGRGAAGAGCAGHVCRGAGGAGGGAADQRGGSLCFCLEPASADVAVHSTVWWRDSGNTWQPVLQRRRLANSRCHVHPLPRNVRRWRRWPTWPVLLPTATCAPSSTERWVLSGVGNERVGFKWCR